MHYLSNKLGFQALCRGACNWSADPFFGFKVLSFCFATFKNGRCKDPEALKIENARFGNAATDPQIHRTPGVSAVQHKNPRPYRLELSRPKPSNGYRDEKCHVWHIFEDLKSSVRYGFTSENNM